MSHEPSEAGAAGARAREEKAGIDLTFVDDLTAASNFKAFLIGRGIEVPDKILEGLGEFSYKYDEDIEGFRASIADKYGKRPGPGIGSLFSRKASS
jgi:hypothetical protein